MAQWINLNCNNRSVLVHRYSVLGGPILLLLVGLMAGREGGREGGREVSMLADKMWVGFEIFKILCRLNYSSFILFVITGMLLQY